jgi:hypothetical protein
VDKQLSAQTKTKERQNLVIVGCGKTIMLYMQDIYSNRSGTVYIDLIIYPD